MSIVKRIFLFIIPGDMGYKYEFWKEYPERDTEYVRVYPPTVRVVDPNEIWKKKEMGLYIQIPFCKSICKYCPFNKFPWNSQNVEAYLKALKKEIEMVSSIPYVQNGKIIALSVGGGTPTSLETSQMLDVLGFCQEKFDFDPKVEISVEANPETVDEKKIKALLNIGVNRISFGVQSFNDYFLNIIGRAHKAEQAITAIKKTQDLGLDNIGIDLLYRIPDQTVSDWEKDLEQAVKLKIDHISTFSLLLNPGTQLFKERVANKLIPQPSEEVELAMYEKTIQLLSNSGYHHYIVYDFVLPGKECKYHSICWEAPQREYPGLGAGANSFIHGYFYGNINPLEEYIETVNSGKLPISFGRKLTKEDEMSRFMVLGIKFLKVDKRKFKECFGIEVTNIFGETIQRLEKWELIVNEPNLIRLTDKGKKYISNVNKEFYTKEHKGKPQPVGIQLQKKEGPFFESFSKVS